MIPAPILLHAYRTGLFPMGVEDGQIGWFSPDPRGILPLERFRLPRRVLRVVRQGRFHIRINQAFDEVIHACARGHDTWINPEIIESYRHLHRLGFAHSVEAWRDERLVGGLYGVAIQGAFFGESMFYHVPDASKIALHALVERLRTRGYRLLDIQWMTRHLEAYGASEIPRAEYLALLDESLRLPCRFTDPPGREGD